MKAQRGSRGLVLLFLYLSGKWEWMVKATPWPLYTGKETRYPLYRKLGGPQCRSGRLRKISSPLGFNPRTVQPVASRLTHWTILARLPACMHENSGIFFFCARWIGRDDPRYPFLPAHSAILNPLKVWGRREAGAWNCPASATGSIASLLTA